MATSCFARVLLLGLTLPGVEESISYGTPALKVRNKFLCRMKEDGQTLVIKCADLDEKEFLLQTEPEIFFETDHAPFLIRGVPAFVLDTAFEKYMQLHHKPSDTFDKVNQRDLNLGVATVAVTAYAFADASNTLKHYSTKEVEDQLKAIKAFAQYQDLLDHHVL